jgi:hypothetical protein
MSDDNAGVSATIQLWVHNALEKFREKEREVSDAKYADILTQRIVRGAVGIILVAVFSSVVYLVVNR